MYAVCQPFETATALFFLLYLAYYRFADDGKMDSLTNAGVQLTVTNAA